MKVIRGVLALSLGLASAFAGVHDTGGGKFPWNEYDRLVEARSAFTARGRSIFGDEISSNALSFSAVDVSIPGNRGLPAAPGRKYSAISRKGSIHDRPLRGWGSELGGDAPRQRRRVAKLLGGMA